MARLFTTVLGAVLLCIGWTPAAAMAEDSTAFDREFVQAASKGDAVTLSKLLDNEFTWTEADGRTLSRAEVLGNVPRPALGDESGANVVKQSRTQVFAIMTDRDKVHVLRVWTKRGSEWRLLVYQEVALGRGGAAPSEAAAKDCDNPCKTVPYKAKNEIEQSVMASWEELETAVATRDSFGWAPHIASEFRMLGSSNDHPLSKADRIATLNLQKVTGRGALPAPVVSVQMFDFGDSVVMTAVHQPATGKAQRATRLWIKREGKWQMSLSFQTTIENSTAKAG